MYMLGEYGALDDAMTAFGRMAMTIRVRDANYRGGDAAHTSVHASVGNWNLPAVRVLDISVDTATWVILGNVSRWKC